MKKLFYRNNLWFGVLLGVLLPVISYFLLRYLVEATKSPSGVSYLDQGTVHVLSIVANVFLFRFYMIKLKFDETGKGMLLATFIYAFVYMFKYLG